MQRTTALPRRQPAWLAVVAFAALLAALMPTAREAQAQLTVDITRGQVEPLPIALPDFYAAAGDTQEMARQIPQVVASDLASSGLFRPLDARAFIQTPESLSVAPRFVDWRQIQAQALVSGVVERQSDGLLRVEFRLWDVLAEQQIEGLSLSGPQQEWRRIAHKIADAVYKRLTGEGAYFDSQIVYVAESGPQNRRVKRLAIMDQDGANGRYLTSGATLVLTPRFAPNDQEITYMEIAGRTAQVKLLDLGSGREQLLGSFQGMTFAPRFSPDGNRLVLSLARDGNSDIYLMDLRSRRLQRLTNHPAIDTSPSFSPDGSEIVFNSDRGGTQQLYVMSTGGGEARRISFGDGRYATPVWSPRGDLIAFTRIQGGTFYIGVMRPDGSQERMLARAFLVEGPTWAPNGRVIAFYRQEPADSRGNVRSRLYSVDVTGFNEREIPTPTEASDPAWSPLRP